MNNKKNYESNKLNTIYNDNNKKYKYHSIDSQFLNSSIEYNVFSLEEETEAIYFIRQHLQPKNQEDELKDDDSNRRTINTPLLFGTTDLIFRAKQAKYKASILLEKLLSSMIPYIVGQLEKYFCLKYNRIFKIDDYISECRSVVSDFILKSDKLIMGKPLSCQLCFEIWHAIEDVFCKIGGYCSLTKEDLKERTKVFKIISSNPNLTNVEIVEILEYKKNTKAFLKCLDRISRYNGWANTNSDYDNDCYYFAPDFNNDIESNIDYQAKNMTYTEITQYVEHNFSERDYEIYRMSNNLDYEYDDVPSKVVIAKKFNTTSQNVIHILKKIRTSIDNAVKNGIIKKHY